MSPSGRRVAPRARAHLLDRLNARIARKVPRTREYAVP